MLCHIHLVLNIFGSAVSYVNIILHAESWRLIIFSTCLTWPKLCSVKGYNFATYSMILKLVVLHICSWGKAVCVSHGTTLIWVQLRLKGYNFATLVKMKSTYPTCSGLFSLSILCFILVINKLNLYLVDQQMLILY